MKDFIAVTCSVVNNPPKDYSEIAQMFNKTLTVSVDTSEKEYSVLVIVAYSFEQLNSVSEFLQHLKENNYLILRD